MLAAATWCGTFIHSTAAERAIFAAHQFQHGNYRGVQTERWHSARLELLGRFFKQRRRSPSESLATSAIGAIGFYADMKVYDLHGLVDTHIAHLPPPSTAGRGRPGHERRDLAYTIGLRPTYLMFSRSLTPDPEDLHRYVPEALRPTVDREYQPVTVWLNDPRNRERGYFTFYERRHR